MGEAIPRPRCERGKNILDQIWEWIYHYKKADLINNMETELQMHYESRTGEHTRQLIQGNT